MKTTVINFFHQLKAPCHTSAYNTGRQLDKMLLEILSQPSTSDYGHSRNIIETIIEAYNIYLNDIQGVPQYPRN